MATGSLRMGGEVLPLWADVHREQDQGLPSAVKNGSPTVCLLAKRYCATKLGVLKTQMGRLGMLYNQYNEAFQFQSSITVSQIFLNDHNIERAKGREQIRANAWPLQAGMLLPTQCLYANYEKVPFHPAHGAVSTVKAGFHSHV